MVDLHTHILPGIDDGAETTHEALLLSEALYRQNIRIAVCTPHFDSTKTSLQEFVSKRTAAILQMQPSKILLKPGSETILNDYLFYYPDLSCLCIDDTRYILLEMPFTRKWSNHVIGMLDQLVYYYSLIPIIAHIERYPAARNKKHIRRLIDAGCIIQVNATSIFDRKYCRRVLHYIRNGLIDVVASDCHNMNNRPPVIGEAYDRISVKIGMEFSRRMQFNAECIVDGIDIRKKTEYLI
jgi:protein-tyrosine phosphatase